MKTDIRYFVYNRKSTDEVKRQVLSLDAQSRELREFAKREHLVIADKMDESMTAKAPGRPKFNRMMQRLERGEANGILVWDIDRLYRNPADEGQVRWMLQRGIIASIRTPTREYTPADAGLLIAVEGGRATDFIIHHKRDVARGVREKLLRGEWAAGQRPLGYLYDHDRRNIVPDPKRAKIVETIFREFSMGDHGLVWASDRLAQLGVLTETGKHWSKWQVRYLLTNRLYTGVMVWNGEVFEGKFKPIISPELFKNVQKALKIRSKPRKTRVGHNFPFCGLFPCSCGSMMSAQWARGNGGLYRYYRCTRKTRKCSEPYVQETSVSEQCLKMVMPLGISANDAAFVRTLIDKQTEKDTVALETDTKEIVTKISDVQAKLNKLTRAYVDALVDEESYQAAKADLILEKTILKGEKERFYKTRSDYWNEPAKDVINTLELAGKVQIEKSPQEISQLVRKVGTNRLISQKRVSFNFSEPYDFALSFLGNLHLALADTPSLRDDENWWSSKWCAV